MDISTLVPLLAGIGGIGTVWAIGRILWTLGVKLKARMNARPQALQDQIDETKGALEDIREALAEISAALPAKAEPAEAPDPAKGAV